MSYPHRQQKTVAYVVHDDQHDIKRGVIEGVAKLLDNPHVYWLTAEPAPELGFFDRPDHRRIWACLNRGDRFLVCLPDFGGRLSDLYRASELFARRGVTLYWVLPDEVLCFEPVMARGLDVLPPDSRAKLEGAWRRVNREFQVEQFRRSVKRRRQQRLLVSRRPPLGSKFMARGGKTYLVKDRAFHLWVARLLKWREEGLTIDQCQKRLSRAGAKNPATGAVWSYWRIRRALKWARQQGGRVEPGSA